MEESNNNLNNPEELNNQNDMTSDFGNVNPDITFVQDILYKAQTEIHKVIIGNDDVIEFLFAGLLVGGHVLIEGVPGIAKTLTVKLMARTLDVDYKRIQFTPDLMPSDVVGTNVYNMKTSKFDFRKGPIFSNVILADEINRAPAKTQAALFEVMEEKQVTVDGETYQLDFPLFVVATQNPIEHEGTYRLPEAQLDRFIFKIKYSYPSQSQEKEILNRLKEDFDLKANNEVRKIFDRNDLVKCRDIIEKIHIKDELLDYIVKIVDSTRNHGEIFLGASPRASLFIMKSAKAIAAFNGRDFVTPDDIKNVSYRVLNHRIILTPEKEIEGIEEEDIIKTIIEKVEVPR